MRSATRRITLILALLALLAPGALAQSSSDDRLFLSFAEDATIVDSQWWEGQIELADWDNLDVMVLRGIVAFQPLQDVEVGGRVGFGDTDSDFALGPDGSGATDLDVWAKYYMRASGSDDEFALGGLLTIPTGDDAAGLGADSFGARFFGSWRRTLPNIIVTANAGVQLNEDGMIGGVEIEGETAPFLAGGVIFPVSDRLTLTGEAKFEGERFDGADEDIRIVGGVNWRAAARGQVRIAIGIGLEDGAPDTQILGGYAYSF